MQALDPASGAGPGRLRFPGLQSGTNPVPWNPTVHAGKGTGIGKGKGKKKMKKVIALDTESRTT